MKIGTATIQKLMDQVSHGEELMGDPSSAPMVKPLYLLDGQQRLTSLLGP